MLIFFLSCEDEIVQSNKKPLAGNDAGLDTQRTVEALEKVLFLNMSQRMYMCSASNRLALRIAKHRSSINQRADYQPHSDSHVFRIGVIRCQQ